MRRTSFNTSASSGVAASGIFRATVVSVGDDDLLQVKIPKLGLNNVYEGVSYAGPTPAVGDVVFVGFLEGKSGSFVAFTGVVDSGNTGDPAGDITSVVAGTNLNGGGSSGTVTVNLDSDITLTSVTADAFYGDLYGAIHILVKNVSGGSLTKGTPVHATGAVGASGAVEVEASLAGTGSTMPAMGLLDQDLDHNGQGDVVVSGVLQNIDTDTPGYSVGDELYVAPSGGLTTTRPSGASELVQKIGKVIRVQQNTGEILVQGAGRTNDVPNVVVAGGLAIDTDTLYVDATNDRVGIGTTSPETPLNIVTTNKLGSTFTGTTDGEGLRVDQSNYTSGNYVSLVEASYDDGQTAPHVRIGAMFDGSGSHLAFGTSNSYASGITNTALFIDETGKVGINTSSPGYDLTVGTPSGNASVQIMAASGGYSQLWFGDGGTNQWHMESNPGGTELKIVETGVGYPLTILPGNKVGIGTTTPSQALDVVGSGKFTDNLQVDDWAGFNASPTTNIPVRAYQNTLTYASNDTTSYRAEGNWGGGYGFYEGLNRAMMISPGGNTWELFVGGSASSWGTKAIAVTSSGSVSVPGALSKGSGSFRIPHPLPALSGTHDLVHSFVEAPQADNIYRGKATLVAGASESTVSVNIDTAAGMTDGTFVLLNRDVQAFTSNEDSPCGVYSSISGNVLTITGEHADCDHVVSWMVIGERQDQHMYDTAWTDVDGRVIVEPTHVETDYAALQAGYEV